jgi:NitT/TauT family transport system substrate-binding protein
MVALVLVGCRGAGSPAEPLRIAVLPILDTLPLYVAEAEGYFAEESIAVEFVAAASAAERDQLLQAGQVDGVITDMVALALYNSEEAGRIVAVRAAMVPTPQHAQFRVLTSGSSGITTAAELRGVEIGVSEGTVIEYVTDRLLAAEGLSPDTIVSLAVPRIPERMALLTDGNLDAATLPEPLASLAVQQGATVVVDDRAHPGVSGSVFAFRATTLDANPESVRGLLRAVDRASAAINADKDRWADLLVERQLVPPVLEDTYTLPTYPTGAGNAQLIPTEGQFADVIAWLQADGRLADPPPYDAVVTGDYAE